MFMDLRIGIRFLMWKLRDPGLDLSPWPETWRGFITYMASKKLAENPEWALSVVCPTYIGGPCVLKIEGEGDLSFSNGLLWKTAASGGELRWTFRIGLM